MRGEVIEAEGFREEVAHEAACSVSGRFFQTAEGIEMGLADAEGGGDFVADGESLTDTIGLAGILVVLRCGDFGHHGGRDQIALKGERGPGGEIGDRFAGHGSDRVGHQHKEANDIGGKYGRDGNAGCGACGSPKAGVILYKFIGTLTDECGERAGEQGG